MLRRRRELKNAEPHLKITHTWKCLIYKHSNKEISIILI